MTPKQMAQTAYEKWGMPLDENADGIVQEMQADMMVLIGIIYALSTDENTVAVFKDKGHD